VGSSSLAPAGELTAPALRFTDRDLTPAILLPSGAWRGILFLLRNLNAGGERRVVAFTAAWLKHHGVAAGYKTVRRCRRTARR